MEFPRSLPRQVPLPNATSLRLPLGLTPTGLALGAIMVLAALLRFANLEAIGQANTYYTAAVASMLQSWPNFFFVAAEPGGSVSVDKPPLGLWLQTLSAFFLGVNGFAVVLPQLLAGLAAVLLLFHLVQRSFGPLAGLLAALALAVTPVAIAVERNNTPDALLILALLLAAWAFLKASESGKLRWLLLGTFAVGIGFNIKMLQAFLPLPAFYALYLFTAAQPWRKKLRNLLLATALLIPVALAWAVVVDLTPAHQRPYVGGSTNNSALDLIIGYNGIQRLIGGGPGTPGDPPQGDGPPMDGSNRPAPPAGQPDGGRPPLGPDGGSAGPGGPAGGGMFNLGAAGPLRLFQSGLAAQASWLLPVGLLMIVVLGAAGGWRNPQSARHRALILWGGWLLTCVVFFSVASFFHEYYLAMLGAPLAALVGIGLAYLWELRASHPQRAALLLLVAASLTLGFQIYAVGMYNTLGWWIALPLALTMLGTALLLFSLRRTGVWLPRVAFALVICGLLVVPTVWSGLTTAYADTGSPLPQAYNGNTNRPDGAPGPRPGGAGPARNDQQLVDYLQARTQDTKYLLVVPSSQVGARYVLATGRPVLYAGGFNGSDSVIDGDDLAALVAQGDVRYVLWDMSGRERNGDSSIRSYLQSACAVVSDAGLAVAQDGRGGTTLHRCGP